MERWLFNLWFRLAPRAATRWVNGKLEEAAQKDRREQERTARIAELYRTEDRAVIAIAKALNDVGAPTTQIRTQ